MHSPRPESSRPVSSQEGPDCGHACEPAPRPLPPAPVRWALQLFALLSLATGIAGIFIPGLPTTVFVLMAGWAAARSSPRLHAWLWHHRLFGPMLQNWARGGFMSRKAKWSATAMMSLCALILLWTMPPLWVRVVALGCMGSVLIWLWLRPEPSPDSA
ncbi:YbaN family protein [Comamonas composti]|uniref:YbaN family protein n=1 Tax=Comamonas composti TaxID=408558 RepID=UPI000A055513|nr:YbaN family protein [Comamonas composti]